MKFSGTWIDIIIIIICIYFALEAFRVGFWIILADFISFLISLLISLRFYKYISVILRQQFSFSHSFSNAIGFLVVASLSEFFLGYLIVSLVKKIPGKFWKSKFTKVLGVIPAVGEALVLVSFILMLSLGFPLTSPIKNAISSSYIGGFLVKNTSFLESKVNEVFGGLIDDSLTYFTIKPDSYESVPLSIGEAKLSVDEDSERQLLYLVNKEREKAGVNLLIGDDELKTVARAHASDMWERKYFSHYNFEGEDVGDRLDKFSVKYTVAGENLALAPTVETAHTGLMNSEGHKKNILDPEFRRVGIGVIDNGIYGKMFVQVFTD
ncbi:MAG: hypothetical protein US62_C0018G0023 [Candidatus Woesebacteria bacterium GW2011_GWA1_37_8]|uniref:SCP domain-containing protein n=2 Tax=Candidatus Woeseibacteriota TaxID=1752722 RepID=A0A0G0L6Y9_9BACT|nr:MAG: hypothetical protein US62_C0018G0023 [Candidatus Woesebacteria bacterium GW2011_GWA1_37_8]KKQ86782.1 MAG: hypothetical protein UT10_C0017G0024 [Candidatus Woesebacteria bacterium GW2011_GWB1_38_8b]